MRRKREESIAQKCTDLIDTICIVIALATFYPFGTACNSAGCFRKGDPNMLKKSSVLVIASLLFVPVNTWAQSGGGSGGSGGSSGGGAASSAGGAASGPTGGSPSAAGSPNAGATGAGTSSISGVPNGPANQGGLNNSANDPSGAGNSAKVPTAPGTNNLGTAQSTGSSGNIGAGDGSTTTTGVAGNRAGASGGRIDGTVQKGPAMQGDAEISAENAKVDKKVKSICKGC